MKKIITSLAILVLITTSSFAEHSFGVKGSFGASIMQLTNSQKSELGNSASEVMSSLIWEFKQNLDFYLITEQKYRLRQKVQAINSKLPIKLHSQLWKYQFC